MKLKPLVTAAAIMAGAMTPLSASAQINSAQAKGYTTRAEAMLADGNFQGCIDQCSQALKHGTNERELASWLTTVATYRAGFGNARQCIRGFMKQFPQSVHTEQARLMLATLTFYDGDYAAALRQLQAVNITALDLDSAEDCTYRTAFCMLKLGDYDGAEERFVALEKKAAKRYGNAARFYQGYIAYAQEDYTTAARLLSSVNTATSPGDMAPYYLAQIRFKEGNYVEALNQSRRLLGSRSTSVEQEYRDEAERISGESLYARQRNRSTRHSAPLHGQELRNSPAQHTLHCGHRRLCHRQLHLGIGAAHTRGLNRRAHPHGSERCTHHGSGLHGRGEQWRRTSGV